METFESQNVKSAEKLFPANLGYNLANPPPKKPRDILILFPIFLCLLITLITGLYALHTRSTASVISTVLSYSPVCGEEVFAEYPYKYGDICVKNCPRKKFKDDSLFSVKPEFIPEVKYDSYHFRQRCFIRPLNEIIDETPPSFFSQDFEAHMKNFSLALLPSTFNIFLFIVLFLLISISLNLFSYLLATLRTRVYIFLQLLVLSILITIFNHTPYTNESLTLRKFCTIVYLILFLFTTINLIKAYNYLPLVQKLSFQIIEKTKKILLVPLLLIVMVLLFIPILTASFFFFQYTLNACNSLYTKIPQNLSSDLLYYYRKMEPQFEKEHFSCRGVSMLTWFFSLLVTIVVLITSSGGLSTAIVSSYVTQFLFKGITSPSLLPIALSTSATAVGSSFCNFVLRSLCLLPSGFVDTPVALHRRFRKTRIWAYFFYCCSCVCLPKKLMHKLREVIHVSSAMPMFYCGVFNTNIWEALDFSISIYLRHPKRFYLVRFYLYMMNLTTFALTSFFIIFLSFEFLKPLEIGSNMIMGVIMAFFINLIVSYFFFNLVIDVINAVNHSLILHDEMAAAVGVHSPKCVSSHFVYTLNEQMKQHFLHDHPVDIISIFR